MVDTSYNINVIFEFLDLEYKSEIQKIMLTGGSSIIIDFNKLAEFNPDIADQLLEVPQETKACFDIAISNFSQENAELSSSAELTSVRQVLQVRSVLQVRQDFLFPSYLLNSFQKALYLFSIVERATQKEMAEFFKLQKSTVSELFANPSRQSGLVLQQFVELINEPNLPNSDLKSNFYRITPSGVSYLQNLALQHSKSQSVPQETKVSVRFENLPDSSLINIADIRSRHHGKFLTIEGVVRRKSDVRPRAVMLRFECPTCGNIIRVQQNEQNMKIPLRCSCGRKGKFKLLSKELKDIQHVVLEDLGLNSNLAEVKRQHTLLDNDLCDRQKDLQVGNRVLFYGWVEEVPREVAGKQIIDYDILFIVNNFKNLDDKKIELTKEDIAQVEVYARENGFRTLKSLANIFSHNIIGNNHIKKALLLQLVSKDVKDFKTRLRMHIHLSGTWGVGKTELALFSHKVAPKSIFADVTHASGVGLTASVIKDEFLKTWALEAGAIALAGDGLVFLDEIDKQKKEEEISGLGEPMEKGTITVSKANIHQTLQAPAKILTCGNIKTDSTVLDCEALCLKQHIVDRFDLIFRAEDVDDEELTKKMSNLQSENTDQDSTFLRKYIFVALNHELDYSFDEDVNKHLSDFFKKVRTEQADSSLKFSPRLYQSLMRLTIASAKLRLAKKPELFDATVSTNLVYKSLSDRRFWKKTFESSDQIDWEDLIQ